MNTEQLKTLQRMLDNQRVLLENRITKRASAAPYITDDPELKRLKAEWDKTVKRLCVVKKQLDTMCPQPPPKVVFVTKEEREFDKFDKMMRTNGNDFAARRF